MKRNKNITPGMKDLLEKLADLAVQVSDIVYDDDDSDGTMGILNLCDKLCRKIDRYLERE